jgi:hypothetical protein
MLAWHIVEPVFLVAGVCTGHALLAKLHARLKGIELRLLCSIALLELTITPNLFTRCGLIKANGISYYTLGFFGFIHSVDDFTMLFAEATLGGSCIVFVVKSNVYSYVRFCTIFSALDI